MENRNLFTLAGWDEKFLVNLVEKRLSTGLISITTAQYALIYQHLETTGKPVYHEFEQILQAANPGFPVPKKWSNLTRKVMKNLSKQVELQEVVLQVSEDLTSSCDYVGPICNIMGITKSKLFDSSVQHIPGISMTVGCFKELCCLKNYEKKCWHELKKWLNKLQPEPSLSIDKLRYLDKKITDTCRKLIKDKLSFVLEMFKDQLFFKYIQTIRSVRDQTRPHSTEEVKLKKVISTCRTLVDSQRKLHKENDTLRIENLTLKEVLQENRENIQDLQESVSEKDNLKQKNCELKLKVCDLKDEIKVMKREKTYMKKDNIVKRLQRRRKNLEHIHRNTNKKAEILKNKVKDLKGKLTERDTLLEKKVKKLHTISNRLSYSVKSKKNVVEKLLKKSVELENVKQNSISLQMEIANLHDEVEMMREENKNINTKDHDKNRYTDEIRTCVMDLSGIGIPSNKISNVIKSVSVNMYNKENIKLPSKTTVQNICDEGHVIAKEQISEVLHDSTNFDMFSDGTGRDGRKILNVGVNMENKTMLMGYKHVAKEDSATVADVLKSYMYETAEISNKPMSNYLSKLSAMMSDRSSVMKKTNQIIDEWRQSVLSEDMDEDEISKLNFFYCSAHVLLGFHNQITSDLKRLGDHPVGRDLLPQFARFKSSEQPAFRLIRMASEVLGPRGDEKNGARQQWLAYMSSKKKSSNIINYRGNRFNNLFTGAVSIIHHADDISDFLTNYFESPNLKLQSILADIQSPEVISQIAALALLSTSVAEPYWTIVNSNEHYLDFYKFVGPMNDALMKWSEDPNEILQMELNPIFDNYPHIANEYLINKATTLPDISINLKSVCASMAKVVQRQLKDHLPQGLYSEAPADDLRERTKHSSLTNIKSENLFGDLDSAMKRKPNATLRHLTSVSMLKHNHTASWLRSKSSVFRKNILQRARMCAKSLKEKERDYEKHVMEKRKQMINEIKHKKQLAKEKRRRDIRDIELSVKNMGGIVRSKEDVDTILNLCKTIKEKKDKLRKQLLYCKNILCLDIRSCSVQKTVSELKENLFITLKLELKPDLSVGTWIVVSYEDNWYPGEIQIVCDNDVTVKFMCRKNTTFVWPRKDDIQVVEKKFIIWSHFDILPSPGLRYWIVPHVEEIDIKHADFVLKYF